MCTQFGSIAISQNRVAMVLFRNSLSALISKMSIYQAEKGSQRVTLSEWKSKNEQSISITENKLSNSVLERKDGALLRSETKIKSKWDTYHNEDLLSDRHKLHTIIIIEKGVTENVLEFLWFRSG
jgi:hypothetical protein